MSLLGSIQLGANTLRVTQLALQVVGQNISNANTPGYIREEAILNPGPTEKRGGVLLGKGVRIDAVVQKIDAFLEERLRDSVSDRADVETRESVYQKLESILGEFGDSDLSSSLSKFFSSIAEILNQPEDPALRNLAVHGGQSLATSIRTLAQRVGQIRSEASDRVIDAADRINQLLEKIRQLNVRIVSVEAGDISKSDAVGLRDQRLNALEELAGIIDIHVTEDTNGNAIVYNGSDYLVYGGTRRTVEAVLDSDRGGVTAEVHIVDTESPLQATSGELHALAVAQDDILGGFLEQLDDFTQALIYEFNKQYSRGQGLVGYSKLTSEFVVDDADLALNAAGLPFTPVNGSFTVLVRDRQSGQTHTADVVVDLNGVGGDMSLSDLSAALDAVDGISASTTSTGNLTITADDSNREFAFAGDTSGVLAALGLHSFFTGSSAQTIGIHHTVADDPSRFAASGGGFGVDTDNAVQLTGLADRSLHSQQGNSVTGLYDLMVADLAQAGSVNASLAEGARVFEGTLRGQKTATSGVNLDEEAIRMIAYQRAYQATARYIATISELTELVTEL